MLVTINHQAAPKNEEAEEEMPEQDNAGLSQGAKNTDNYHAQIYFMLQHSGFNELQQQGFHWNIHYQGKVFPVTFRMYVPFIVGYTKGHDQLCGQPMSTSTLKSKRLIKRFHFHQHRDWNDSLDN